MGVVLVKLTEVAIIYKPFIECNRFIEYQEKIFRRTHARSTTR